MDLAQAIRELGRRPGWLLLGAFIALVAGLSTAYRISVFPPALDSKAFSIGSAATQVLIDTPTTSIVDNRIDLGPLSQRALVLSRLATSRPVRAAIAREVGLNETDLQVNAPIVGALPRTTGTGDRERRLQTILEENRDFRLSFTAENGLPAITITAEAPTAEDAVKLANAGSIGFTKYVRRVQTGQDVPEAAGIAVRRLGEAEGGVVGKGINRQLVALTFVGVFFAWCILILVIAGLRRNLATIRDAEQAAIDGRPRET